MSGDTFDRILSSVPLNSTAGRVMSRGEHWEPEGKIPPGLKHWKSPPPMKPFDGSIAHTAAIDLTGKKFGRFTVLGLCCEGAKDGARWVLRCVCGDFEARSAKTIKAAIAGLAPENSLSFQCYYCYSWNAVKSRYKKKGAAPLASFINPTPRQEKRRTAEETIADVVGNYEAAVRVIAKLNRSGFRVVRSEISGIMSEPDTALPSSEGKV